MAPGETEQSAAAPRRAGAVRARVVSGQAREGEARFERTFQVGRGKECDLQLLDTLVSRTHLRVERNGAAWTVRDLGSANGTFLAGSRVEALPLAGPVLLELGAGGPVLSLEPEPAAEAPAPPATASRRYGSETQFLEHVLDAARPGGRETQMMRAAIARVHRKRTRWYLLAIGLAALLLAGAGGVIAWQGRKVARLEQSAERLFYAARALEVQSEKLETLALRGADPALAAGLQDRRKRLRQMEEEYQGFVRELGVYEGKPEDERIILRVARIFGECDVNVPRSFVEEVRRYVKRWKSSDRLANALARAEEKGYTPRIVRTLTEEQLPHQFIFLALQESNFDERAVGRPTRYGHAKGMWQFIAQTGTRYGLRIGPLRDQGVYDPGDERFHVEKATRAAARYIRDLRATEAQASGLLVMASYNWGETKVRQIIEKLPENPQERNFWRLLARKDVPQETYDYVLSIFSAAVICENPAFFGVEVRCPAPPAGAG
jgi:soluble lytic murein transglycosylase-like protein